MPSRPLPLLFLVCTLLALGCGEQTCDSAACPEADCDTDADGDTDTDTDTDSDADTDAGSLVVVTGGVYLEVGETLALEAVTYNAEDDGYGWTSSDQAIATVTDGVVTGASPGEVFITAAGDDSGAEGSIGLYVATTIPHWEEWAGSPHADRAAEAFTHWDEEDPPEVEQDCAKCHSTPGFLDFIGADGTDPEVTDGAHAIGTVIECEACHNPVADALSHVVMPSGVTLGELGGEARCMTCHQGRESKDSLDAAINELGDLGDDEVHGDLGFSNIHYAPAAAMLYAGEARGGYQYDGMVYDWRFRHVAEMQVCTDCHDPHTTEVQLDDCVVCHEEAADVEDLRDVRMVASMGTDYDGDGDLTEGIYYEIEGLGELLFEAILAYPAEVGASAVCYSAEDYPYWFTDTDSDGACSSDEAQYANAFGEWSPRLLKAAYNYQAHKKEPGAYAHNAKYAIELLYDSIASLNEALSVPISLDGAARTDQGHFNGAGEAARYWDEDEEVSSSCAQCHGGAEGFLFYLDYEVGLAELPQGNGLECETCHVDAYDYAVLEVESVLLPSGVELEHATASTNVCSNCHAGRKSMADVDQAIADGDLEFQNVHYAPAAAILAGADGAVGYEFEGRDYAGASEHEGGTDCVTCHTPTAEDHGFDPEATFGVSGSTCAVCHPDASTVAEIRGADRGADYDGDGDASEALSEELNTLLEAVYGAIQDAGLDASAPVCYDEHTYPYWMNDTDGDGTCDESEASYSNSYGGWTPEMLQAAFNYQMVTKEHGAWAHNFDYAAQLLIDSVGVVGGDTSGFERPE